MIQLSTECADVHSRVDLAEQKQAIKSWLHRQRVRESALHEIAKVNYPTQ